MKHYSEIRYYEHINNYRKTVKNIMEFEVLIIFIILIIFFFTNNDLEFMIGV